jgi:ATPase subunit of ABC transporter with duplicated ATPase domains
MPAIERLEEALAEYPGALVMVTHDQPLARRVTREEWVVESGQVKVRSR